MIGIANGSQSSSSGNWTSSNNSPVCEDNSSGEVWNDWGASQRDLFVLDLNGDLVLHQNISGGIPDNLETLIIDLLSQTGPDLCSLENLYVSEAHSSGDPADYIEIHNIGSADCSLEGFKLDINQDFDDLMFGNVIIDAGGFWLGYENGDSSFTSTLSSNGEEVWLSDPFGNTKMVTLYSSADLNGVQLSQSFTSMGEGCYTNPTPGEVNSDCITLDIHKEYLLPANIAILNNFPNPFNPSTYITLQLKSNENISVSIFDLKGQFIKTIFEGLMGDGKHKIIWRGVDTAGNKVGSGIYFCVVKSENSTHSKKIVMTK